MCKFIAPEITVGYWRDGCFCRCQDIVDPNATMYIDVAVSFDNTCTLNVLLNETGWITVSSTKKSLFFFEDFLRPKIVEDFVLSIEMRDLIYAKLKEDGFPRYGDFITKRSQPV